MGGNTGGRKEIGDSVGVLLDCVVCGEVEIECVFMARGRLVGVDPTLR